MQFHCEGMEHLLDVGYLMIPWHRRDLQQSVVEQARKARGTADSLLAGTVRLGGQQTLAQNTM